MSKMAITAVRPSGDVVVKSSLGSYMTINHEDLTDLIEKLCIVKNLGPKAFEGIYVDGTCIVDKIV